ncbi:MAG: hypothetical protein ACLFTK_11740 [Anaerolineales bacterium]
MIQTEALVERVWRVAPGLQRLALAADPALLHIAAGQFVLAQTAPDWSPYLRETWTPVDIQEGQLIVEPLAARAYSPGQQIDLLGPLGQPFPWVGGGGKRLLLIAMDAPPRPLLHLAHTALANTAEVALVLLGTARDYPFAGIPAAVEVITGEIDGGWADRDATLAWPDQIFATVPPHHWDDYGALLYHLTEESRGTTLPAGFLFMVANWPMPCGVGACTACMLRTTSGLKTLCTDGPALDMTDMRF